MLNIKDCKCAVPRTWKSVTEYDFHKYKEDRLTSNDLEDFNITLIDNLDSFEEDVAIYKEDLTKSYKTNRNTKTRKTDQEINQAFHTSHIMRTFRLSVNHIELDSLHKPNDNEHQRRKNIVNFYNDCLNEFQNVLNEDLKTSIKDPNYQNQKIKIVLADVHFDQTSAHLHIHVSNIIKRFSKTLKQEILTCNKMKSDAIKILSKQAKEQNYKNSINEIFTQKLRNKKENLELINQIDLKKIFTKYYDVQLYKKEHNIKNLNVVDYMYEGKLRNSYERLNWREDKEIFFHMTKEHLLDLNLKIDNNNEITNSRKLEDLTLYCWKQSIAMQMVQQQRYDYDLKLKENKNSGDEPEPFKPDLSQMNNNKYVEELLQKSLENDYLSFTIIQPHEIKEYQHMLLSNISGICPELKSIEEELIKTHNLFKDLNQSQILNNHNFFEWSNNLNMDYAAKNHNKTTMQNNIAGGGNGGNNNISKNLSCFDYKNKEEKRRRKAKTNTKSNVYVPEDNTLKPKKQIDINSYYLRQKKLEDVEKEKKIEKIRQLRK